MGLHLVFQNVQRILFIHGGSKFKSTLVEKNRRQRGSRWLNDHGITVSSEFNPLD